MMDVVIAFIGGAVFGYAIIEGIIITVESTKKYNKFEKPLERSPYCIYPLHESLCAMVQTGGCSIDSDWMCPSYVLQAMRHLDKYPWWRRIYIKHVYNKYLKNSYKTRRKYTPSEFLEEMEKW